MGWPDLARGKAMVVGATGAIGSVCSRLLAAAVKNVVLVSIEPPRLEALKRTILGETPDARVETDVSTAPWIGQCDLIITATSAFGLRVLDVSQCKPGAVILDVALPPDISAEEAAVRPDILVVESGEVLIPGPVRFSFDIGLPPSVAYACLAEAALLAMEERFECFTLGRDVAPERVKEIYRLFRTARAADRAAQGVRPSAHRRTRRGDERACGRTGTQSRRSSGVGAGGRREDRENPSARQGCRGRHVS